MYKVAVIGGGVIGGMIARRLVLHTDEIVILEKDWDVAMGQSKANSGIVHAGYDPEPGSLKAKLNVEGSQMMENECRQLGVKYRKNGTLVVAFDEADEEHLKELLRRGKTNGVKDIKIITGDEARKLEKNLSKKVKSALYAPTAGVVCPYELTINAIGNAMDNGARLKVNFNVVSIEKIRRGESEFWQLMSENGETVDAEIVVNCAGVHSDEVAAMAGDRSFKITPGYGEYLLLDKEADEVENMTIFKTPDEKGKGVLAVRTVDGNILLGPTSVGGNEKENKSVTNKGIEYIKSKAGEFFEDISFNSVITQFAGVRAHSSNKDFIIDSPEKGFINVAGIDSPGLSSAPAIGVMVEKMAIEMGLPETLRENISLCREIMHSFRSLPLEEKNRIISENPAFGRIVCRCEEVTEGEIIEAIRRNPGATDVDGVKRRTRSGMGRCQGGFCLPVVMEILSRELNVPLNEITKKGGNSYICTDRTKGGTQK